MPAVATHARHPLVGPLGERRLVILRLVMAERPQAPRPPSRRERRSVRACPRPVPGPPVRSLVGPTKARPSIPTGPLAFCAPASQKPYPRERAPFRGFKPAYILTPAAMATAQSCRCRVAGSRTIIPPARPSARVTTVTLLALDVRKGDPGLEQPQSLTAVPPGPL